MEIQEPANNLPPPNVNKPKLSGFLQSVINILFLPVVLLLQVIKPKETLDLIKEKGFIKALSIKKLIINSILLVFVTFTFALWAGGYYIAGLFTLKNLGFVSEPVSVSGTGSMYPTFPKGEGKSAQEQSKEVVDTPGMFPYPNGIMLLGKRYFGHQIVRGDIVVVENQKIDEISKEITGTATGWVKRVIGLPGESIELKDGLVYINDSPIKEPYTAKAHSTFGEEFLSECNKVTVPADSIFVMGDNRKGSGDSREIGFIPVSDVHYVLPLTNQKGKLVQNWRDTSADFDESSRITLNKDEYLNLLNQKRVEAKVKPLKYQSKLEDSAGRRGEVMLKYDDFSYEATKSGYTQTKAMKDAGYSNIVYGEAPISGYFEAAELIDNQFEFPDTKKFLLDKDYQEVGIAEVKGTLNGCPAQVIVQHFAGYIPPNYKKDVVESWRKSLEDLKSIQPGWAGLKDNEYFYSNNKADVDRLNQIISIRITNMEGIVAKMEANQWLSDEQNTYTKTTDAALYNEQDALSTKLNNWRP